MLHASGAARGEAVQRAAHGLSRVAPVRYAADAAGSYSSLPPVFPLLLLVLVLVAVVVIIIVNREPGG